MDVKCHDAHFKALTSQLFAPSHSRWSPPTDDTRPDIKTSLRALSIEVTNNSQSLALWQGADTHKKEVRILRL